MTQRWYMRLAKFAPKHWRTLLGISLLMLFTAGLEALKPWPLKLFVDHVASSGTNRATATWPEQLPGAGSSVGQLAWLSLATLFIFVAAWITQTAQAYLQSGVALRMTYELGAQLFEHLQRLSLRFHGRRPSGDLVRRVMHDSRCVRELILEAMVPGLTALLSLGSMVLFMWWLDPGLTMWALLVIPGLAVADRMFYRPMMERSLEQQQREGQLWSHAEQTLTAIPMIQVFRREAFEKQRYSETAELTLAAYFRALAAQVKFDLAINGATVLGRGMIMVVGGLHVLDGRLSVGGLLVFLSYLLVLYEPLESLARLAATVATTQASAQRVFEVLDSADTVQEPVNPIADLETRPITGHIEFQGVRFGYDSDVPVVRDIELEIKPGETIALVGATGAGKSTLASLLLRFFDPCAGSITLDGIDLRQIRVTDLRRQIAVLLQEPFLLPVSIAENIAYGRADASREAIIAAAKASNADDFISRLPDGYDTLVGERGVTLSGGEKQRIAIARALLKDAPILILDEPTAALDTRTEASVMTAFERLTHGRTTLIIAHRLSTIRRADRIVVLENGRIVESGTHNELIAARGAYARYCGLQSLDADSSSPYPDRDSTQRLNTLETA